MGEILDSSPSGIGMFRDPPMPEASAVLCRQIINTTASMLHAGRVFALVGLVYGDSNVSPAFLNPNRMAVETIDGSVTTLTLPGLLEHGGTRLEGF